MTGKLTAALEADVLAMIRVWRDAPLDLIDGRIQYLRDEAARREAGDASPNPRAPFTSIKVGPGVVPDNAPPPPADDVPHDLWVSAIDAYDTNRQTGHCDAIKAVVGRVREKDAAAIEALRAREKALEGALRWAKGYVPRVRGAEIIDQALAAGGADA